MPVNELSPAMQTTNHFLEAFASWNIDRILGLLDADIIWKTYGNPRVPWTGRGVRHGYEQVSQYFHALFPALLPVSFNITLKMEQGEHVALFGNYTYLVKANDRLLASDWAIVIKAVNGLVTYFSMYEDTYAIDRAVLGPGDSAGGA